MDHRLLSFRSGTGTSWVRLSWHSLLAGAAIAPLLLAFYIQKKHWINIPIWDEWDTPGRALLRHAQGALTWQDLFAQHNESRKVIPRLIHLAIASVAGWDVRQGMVLTFLCVCGASAWALVYLRRRPNLSLTQALVPWLLINVFLFAPSQYENFLSGFVFEVFLPFLYLFACCAINLSRWPLLLKAVFNSLLALIATYTFAHGMLLWAFAIPIPFEGERLRATPRFYLAYLVYLAAGLIVIAGYFIGYQRPEIAPPSANLTQLPQVLDFMIVWLGAFLRSPFVNVRLGGAFVSLLIAAMVTASLLFLRRNKKRWRGYYPWLLLLAFALSSGAITAIGRVNIGVDGVFNTIITGFSGIRYNATSGFVYVAVIGLVFNLYHDRLFPNAVWRSRFRIGFSAGCIVIALGWVAIFSEESIRAKQFQANRRRARTAVIWSNGLPGNPEIFLAYPYPELFWQRVEQMRAAGLIRLPKASDALRDAIAKVPSETEPENGRLELGVSLPPAYHRFAGWVRSPLKQAAADYVVLGWEDAANSFHPFTAIPTGIIRLDVARAHGPSSLKAGFDQDIETSKLPPEAATIRAWAIDWEAQQAFAVDGVVVLDRSFERISTAK